MWQSCNLINILVRLLDYFPIKDHPPRHINNPLLLLDFQYCYLTFQVEYLFIYIHSLQLKLHRYPIYFTPLAFILLTIIKMKIINYSLLIRWYLDLIFNFFNLYFLLSYFVLICFIPFIIIKLIPFRFTATAGTNISRN